MRKRDLSETKELAAALADYFGDRDLAITEYDIIACPCTKPRGYWTGMPLILQRNPDPIRLTELLIINFVEKVYIRHATCPDCGKLYIKEEVKAHAQPNEVRREPASAR